MLGFMIYIHRLHRRFVMVEAAGKLQWSLRHGLAFLPLLCWDQLGGGVGGREDGSFRIYLSWMP
jgi:hypothetical protein